jgi:hypothetical protein
MLQMPSTYEPPKQPSPVLALQELSDILVQQLVANVDSTSRLAIAVSLQSPPGTGNDNLRVVMTEKLKAALFRTGKFTIIEDPQMDEVLSQFRVQDELKSVLSGGKSPEIPALAKVQGVVLCSFIDLGPEWAVQARLIPLRTGTWAATAEGNLPKMSVTGETPRTQTRKPSYLGTLYLGDDGLELSVTSVSRTVASDTIKVKYALFNGGNRDANARLIEPEQRAYIADAAGNTFPFMGAEGLVQQELRVRPGSRAECALVFRVPTEIVAGVRIFVEWDLSGRSWGAQRQFVLNIPASALQ